MFPPDAPASPTDLATDLLTWFASARRDLPWRYDRNPYAVWISEAMLQQTQVATAGPYFQRWLERFPDVPTLAAAQLDDVLKAWEGLGYYARARNLHAAARQIMAEHEGVMPADRAALLRLPGVGAYTAGAILSLAFGHAEPVLDGNVRRVLCRLYDIADDPRAPAVERRLWGLAEDLVRAAPPGQAGDLNEAIMELGALICRPAAPRCGVCALSSHCRALALGVQTDRPYRVRRRPTPHYDAVAAVLRDASGRYLIARRPPEGLLGGLWEFPGTRTGAGQTGQRTLRDLAAALVASLEAGLGVRAVIDTVPLVTIDHAYTHFRITLHAFRGRLTAGEPTAGTYAAVAWVSPDDFARFALPVTDRKIVAILAE